MKNKSILYLITQGEYGGAQHYILDLALAIRKDYSVKIAFGEGGKSDYFTKLLKENNIPYFVIPELQREISFKKDLKALKSIRSFLKKERPSIIHLNSSKISILGALATIGIKSKVVYTAHGWVFNEKIGKQRKLFYTLSEKFTQGLKDKIICVSECDRLLAITNNISPKNKLSMIHNGIGDFEILDKESAKKEIASQSNKADFFEEGSLVLGSIGYLYKNKGYDYLLNAVKILTQNNIKTKLILIGSGPEETELHNWIRQLNLEKDVLIIQSEKQASRLLKAFDIYVCSSLKEGLSYTLIEAMTAALPIIATDVGGNPELINDQKEGLLIKAEDSEAIASAVIDLVQNQVKAREYAQNAQRKAKSEFNIENMIQKTKYLYDSL